MFFFPIKASVTALHSSELLPETARAEPDGGCRVSPLFIHHALRAPEMFEQEMEIILRGLEGQLVQQLLGRRGLGGKGEKSQKESGELREL